MTEHSHAYLPEHDPEPISGLYSDECIADVESLMLELGIGTRLARAGQMVQELLAAGGKRVRARLALAAAEALGVPRAEAVAWAAACELLHNATLVHDDIEDGDTHRRGTPTTWVRHGIPQAINAGDLLLMLPYRALEQLDTSDAIRWRLSRALARTAEATVRGQSYEMDLLGSSRFGWDDWTLAAAGKTGAMLALPIEGAALLAGYAPEAAAALAADFAKLGLVYQLHDDALDASASKGRPAGSDVAAGKVSALVVAHLALRPGDAAWLQPILARPRAQTAPEDITQALQRFRRSGAVQMVLSRAEALGASVRTSDALIGEPALHALALDLLALLVRA